MVTCESLKIKGIRIGEKVGYFMKKHFDQEGDGFISCGHKLMFCLLTNGSLEANDLFIRKQLQVTKRKCLVMVTECNESY